MHEDYVDRDWPTMLIANLLCYAVCSAQKFNLLCSLYSIALTFLCINYNLYKVFAMANHSASTYTM